MKLKQKNHADVGGNYPPLNTKWTVKTNNFPDPVPVLVIRSRRHGSFASAPGVALPFLRTRARATEPAPQPQAGFCCGAQFEARLHGVRDPRGLHHRGQPGRRSQRRPRN